LLTAGITRSFKEKEALKEKESIIFVSVFYAQAIDIDIGYGNRMMMSNNIGEKTRFYDLKEK
jgi:hypothetical protein